jgi:hypothetical protein
MKGYPLSCYSSLNYGCNIVVERSCHCGSFFIFYSISIAVVAFEVFIGSGFISPAMANVVNKIPFINIDNHNVVQLKKNPSQMKAYLNLVSAFNKGNETAYQNAFSQTLSAETIKNNNEEFYVGVRENHQFSATLDLMYSYDKKAILLSREVHAFNSVCFISSNTSNNLIILMGNNRSIAFKH